MAFFYETSTTTTSGGKGASKRDPNVKSGKVTGAIAVLILLFVGGLLLETSHPKAADGLFAAFQVLFTGVVALFGIESAKAN